MFHSSTLPDLYIWSKRESKGNKQPSVPEHRLQSRSNTQYLQCVKKAGIITVARGTGGAELCMEPSHITLYMIYQPWSQRVCLPWSAFIPARSENARWLRIYTRYWKPRIKRSKILSGRQWMGSLLLLWSRISSKIVWKGTRNCMTNKNALSGFVRDPDRSFTKPLRAHFLLFWLFIFQDKFHIFQTQTGLFQQIRTVFHCTQERLLSAPFSTFLWSRT